MRPARPPRRPSPWFQGPAVSLALAALAAAPAGAAPAGEVGELARSARTDPSALERLREIDSVDGRRADLELALRADRPEDLDRRLDQLRRELEGGVREADTSGLRERAEAIVEDLPEGQADEAGADRRTEPDAIGSGGLSLGPFGWVLAALALLGGVLAGRRLLARRERSFERRNAPGARETPDRLQVEADRAEREHDYESALRLRLRWALGVLAGRGAISREGAMTPGAAARQLADPLADSLVETHARVVYGGRPAGAQDAAEARRGWERIVDSAGSG